MLQMSIDLAVVCYAWATAEEKVLFFFFIFCFCLQSEPKESVFSHIYKGGSKALLSVSSNMANHYDIPGW